MIAQHFLSLAFISMFSFLFIAMSGYTQTSYKPLKLDEADEIENIRIDNQDIIKAHGNVRFSQDTLTATCDEAAFFRDLQTAIFIGNVMLYDQHRTLYCDKSKFYAKQKKSVCEGDVIFVDSTTTLASDSITYFQESQKLYAQGHVVIYDSLEAVTLYGDEGFYDSKKKYAYVKGNPRLIQFDSTRFKGQNIARMSRGEESKPILDSTGKPQRYNPEDQIFARGNFVEAFIDTHKVIATDSVIFIRDKLKTRSERGIYWTKKEKLFLDKNPVATYERSRMDGDSMVVEFYKKEAKTIRVDGHAQAKTPSDSAETTYNSLKAKSITMNLKNKKLDTMVAKGNAYNLYYMDNKEGANEISGPLMTLFFLGKSKLQRFEISGVTEGTYYPKNINPKTSD